MGNDQVVDPAVDNDAPGMTLLSALVAEMDEVLDGVNELVGALLPFELIAEAVVTDALVAVET